MLGMVVNSIVMAGAMGSVCLPGSITVPCKEKLLELGGEALYLRSIYGAEKGYQLKYNSSTGGLSSDLQDVRTVWNWGYRIMGSYHFNTGNDVSVNWMHFSSTGNNNTILAPVPLTDLDVLFFPGTMESSNRLDQVNIVMGQKVSLGMRDKMRFYAGMQYANIQSQEHTDVSIVALVTSPSYLFDNTDYKGFGPAIGIDYSYDLGLVPGLSLTANGAGSLLYGTDRYHEGYVVDYTNLIVEQVYASKKAVVPSLEAKLGLNYAYNFLQGIVHIDAGYQVVNYFSVLSTQVFQIPTNPQIVSANYGLFGPYFGMKYVG